nr:hypothetical protein [uncultured Acetobacterium sp.]
MFCYQQDFASGKPQTGYGLYGVLPPTKTHVWILTNFGHTRYNEKNRCTVPLRKIPPPD